MEVTNEITEIKIIAETEITQVLVDNELTPINVYTETCTIESKITIDKSKIYDGNGDLVAELSQGETFIIHNHEIKRSDDSIVVEQLFNENYTVEDTVINDQGTLVNVKYQDNYSCSTLEKRNLFVDFSEGKIIDIVIDTDTRATYTTCNDPLAIFKKNTIVVTLPFTVEIGDTLNIEVTAITSTKLKLEGEYA